MSYFNDAVSEELEKKNSSFYQLEVGKNEFRIVSEFAWGYRYNFKYRAEGEAKDYPFYKLGSEEAEANKSKLVLTASMAVFDYRDKTVKPFNIQQKNILNAIKEYVENSKFGDPQGYDLVITKKGEGKETRYAVLAMPPEAPNEDVIAAMEKVKITLDNAYINEPIIEEVK